LPTATLTSKGQVTIPKEVRRRLKLGSGDRLDFLFQPDGNVTLMPVKADVRELAGMLHRPGRAAVRIEDMDAGVLRIFGRPA